MKRIERIRAMSMAHTLVLLVLAHAAAAMEPGDFKSSLARAVQEDKPLVIDFYTDW
ncbi:hypothetical protein KKG45_09775 [bacterium]|nr:hypothetical protein [bacterium]MBU1073522.1 hypothetical protein [bacterium]MBU1676414.1 hypothetical protein [bacterium]